MHLKDGILDRTATVKNANWLYGIFSHVLHCGGIGLGGISCGINCELFMCLNWLLILINASLERNVCSRVLWIREATIAKHQNNMR